MCLCDPDFFWRDHSWRGINNVTTVSLVTDVKILLEPMVVARYINQQTADNLCGPELQGYVEICLQKQVNFSTLNSNDHCDAISDFWNDLKSTLPLWYDFVTLCMLLIPSSASVERVFSLLKLVLKDQQGRSYNEVIELACQLIFNKRGGGNELD